MRILSRKVKLYAFYSLISFVLVFQTLSNLQLFFDIEKAGKAPGRAGMDLGVKLKAADYVVRDAREKFKQEGLRSYCSIVNDGSYSYIFKYLISKNEDFLAFSEISKGYHYTIFGDINEISN